MTDKFSFCQHNISSVEYYDGEDIDKKNRFISSKDTLRDLKTYINNQDIKYDLYTLQEVEHYGNNEGEININGIKYGYVYNRTGSTDYLINNDGRLSNNYKKIEHGCMVVYDTNRFEYINNYSTYEYEELKYRSSPWLLLKDKKTGEKYIVISIHGLIPSPLTKYKSKRIKNLYNSIITAIQGFCKVDKDNNYSFIIGTDLNINIYNPDLDYYDSKKESIKKDMKKYMRIFLKSLEKYNIGYDLNRDIYTTYSGEDDDVFYDCIDFIFKSKFLNTYEVTYGNNHIGSRASWGEVNEFESDFEHTSIQCIMGIDDYYVK